MKLGISILLALSGGVFAQTAAVTKNPNNNQITGNLVMGANRVLTFEPNSLLSLNGLMRTAAGSGNNGQVQINNSGITFGTVAGMLTVQGRDNHAIVARTPNPTDGIAVVGWSSSGAAGVKAAQDTYFTSPALTAWRDLSLGASGLEFTPGLLVATSGGTAGQTTTQSAVEIQVLGTTHAKITWNGFITSRNKPVMRFHGRLTTAPTGTFGTDFAAGDLYFNTTDSKFYCHDGVSWKAM
jgi:hypothetical protein